MAEGLKKTKAMMAAALYKNYEGASTVDTSRRLNP